MSEIKTRLPIFRNLDCTEKKTQENIKKRMFTSIGRLADTDPDDVALEQLCNGYADFAAVVAGSS